MRHLWPYGAWGAWLCVLASVGDAAAQVEVGRYQFSASVGVQGWAGSSALESGVVGAFDASYYVTPNIALGFFGQAARPKTDPTFFPLVRLTFGSETELHQPAQRVTNYVFGAQARLSYSRGRVAPHALGGLGYYLFTVDAEQNRSDESRDGLALTFGGGASFALSARAGIAVEVRDMVFLDYDRDWFNLADPLFREPRFPDPGATPPAKESTIHNLRFTVGFTYIPGARR